MEDSDKEVQLLIKACRYLQYKTYPLDCDTNEKRSIRRKSERLTLRDGDILYRKTNGQEVQAFTQIFYH